MPGWPANRLRTVTTSKIIQKSTPWLSSLSRKLPANDFAVGDPLRLIAQWFWYWFWWLSP